MTSSNGNIFRVTGHLCGEFTGPGEFPTQRPVTRSFDVYFDLRPNKRLSKQSWGWWFETQSRPLWRHRYDNSSKFYHIVGCTFCSIWVYKLCPISKLPSKFLTVYCKICILQAFLFVITISLNCDVKPEWDGPHCGRYQHVRRLIVISGNVPQARHRGDIQSVWNLVGVSALLPSRLPNSKAILVV